MTNLKQLLIAVIKSFLPQGSNRKLHLAMQFSFFWKTGNTGFEKNYLLLISRPVEGDMKMYLTSVSTLDTIAGCDGKLVSSLPITDLTWHIDGFNWLKELESQAREYFHYRDVKFPDEPIISCTSGGLFRYLLCEMVPEDKGLVSIKLEQVLEVHKIGEYYGT